MKHVDRGEASCRRFAADRSPLIFQPGPDTGEKTGINGEKPWLFFPEFQHGGVIEVAAGLALDGAVGFAGGRGGGERNAELIA
jgi:hypothetical protein